MSIVPIQANPSTSAAISATNTVTNMTQNTRSICVQSNQSLVFERAASERVVLVGWTALEKVKWTRGGPPSAPATTRWWS
jgi:hypothetical protein